MSTPGRDSECEYIPAEEFLEAEDDATPLLPKPPETRRIAPMRLPDKTAKPARQPDRAAPQGPSEATLRFMGWLQQGLADGGIAYNETGAMVHFAAEGMLLISPRIFRHFDERFGEKEEGIPSNLGDDKLGTAIQRAVIKAGWHRSGYGRTAVKTARIGASRL